MSSIRIHPEVEDALKRGAAVVALESAVITSGLPRDTLAANSKWRSEAQNKSFNFDCKRPVNLELARAMQRIVRDAGAIPATVAVIEGELHIGLDDTELVMLASEQCAAKASITDLAALMQSRRSAGATVSATLAACSLPKMGADPSFRIRVFATGGIGGVHRGWQHHPDISADLRQIANTPVCVVCSGAKSILDLPATLETLEALGVPIIGYRTNRFPQFQCTGHDSLHVRHRVDDPQSAARICRTHWDDLHRSTGILLANPVPQEFAMNPDELNAAIAHAEQSASEHKIAGPQRTPYLLAEIARLTQNRSLDANLALLLNNARLAAELAIALAE